MGKTAISNDGAYWLRLKNKMLWRARCGLPFQFIGCPIPFTFDMTYISIRFYAQKAKSVNIGSGNGLVPDGFKSLPEPMMTSYRSGSVVFNSEQFRCEWQSYYSEWLVLKIIFSKLPAHFFKANYLNGIKCSIFVSCSDFPYTLACLHWLISWCNPVVLDGDNDN